MEVYYVSVNAEIGCLLDNGERKQVYDKFVLPPIKVTKVYSEFDKQLDAYFRDLDREYGYNAQHQKNLLKSFIKNHKQWKMDFVIL